MKRRNFIYTGVAVITGFGLSGLYLMNKESKWKKQPFLYPFILSDILDEESLRVIGKSFRVQQPQENSKLTLRNVITNGIQIRTDDLENQAMEIEKNVEMDFKTSKLIVIKGWIISKTEARQCALLSLS